jgi:hypothetical protein
MLYNVGIKINVTKVLSDNPPMLTIAKGTHISEPSPRERASGIIPRIVVIVVPRIGRSLLLPPSTIALRIS